MFPAYLKVAALARRPSLHSTHRGLTWSWSSRLWLPQSPSDIKLTEQKTDEVTETPERCDGSEQQTSAKPGGDPAKTQKDDSVWKGLQGSKHDSDTGSGACQKEQQRLQLGVKQWREESAALQRAAEKLQQGATQTYRVPWMEKVQEGGPQTPILWCQMNTSSTHVINVLSWMTQKEMTENIKSVLFQFCRGSFTFQPIYQLSEK